MGALNPMPIIQAVSSVSGFVSQIRDFTGGEQQDLYKEQELALRQLQQQQNLQQRQSASEAALDKQKLAADAAAAQEARRDALRRAVARQKASFGGRGIASDNGSAQAVLLGLFDESEEDRAERERLDSIRSRAIDLSLENQRALNVLQRAQLAERQKLQRQYLF